MECPHDWLPGSRHTFLCGALDVRRQNIEPQTNSTQPLGDLIEGPHCQAVASSPKTPIHLTQ